MVTRFGFDAPIPLPRLVLRRRLVLFFRRRRLVLWRRRLVLFFRRRRWVLLRGLPPVTADGFACTAIGFAMLDSSSTNKRRGLTWGDAGKSLGLWGDPIGDKGGPPLLIIAGGEFGDSIYI